MLVISQNQATTEQIERSIRLKIIIWYICRYSLEILTELAIIRAYHFISESILLDSVEIVGIRGRGVVNAQSHRQDNYCDNYEQNNKKSGPSAEIARIAIVVGTEGIRQEDYIK